MTADQTKYKFHCVQAVFDVYLDFENLMVNIFFRVKRQYFTAACDTELLHEGLLITERSVVMRKFLKHQRKVRETEKIFILT